MWLLAVESEAQVKSEGDFPQSNCGRELGIGKSSSIMDHTADIITKIDNHLNSMKMKSVDRSDFRENNQTQLKTHQALVDDFMASTGGNSKAKRRAKGFVQLRRPLKDVVDKSNEFESVFFSQSHRDDSQLVEDNFKFEASLSRWEEGVGSAELDSAVLSLLLFCKIAAA